MSESSPVATARSSRWTKPWRCRQCSTTPKPSANCSLRLWLRWRSSRRRCCSTTSRATPAKPSASSKPSRCPPSSGVAPGRLDRRGDSTEAVTPRTHRRHVREGREVSILDGSVGNPVLTQRARDVAQSMTLTRRCRFASTCTTSGLLSVLRGLFRLLGRGAGADSVDEHLDGLLALLEADLDKYAVKAHRL